jgi:hypothetical protein
LPHQNIGNHWLAKILASVFLTLFDQKVGKICEDSVKRVGKISKTAKNLTTDQ